MERFLDNDGLAGAVGSGARDFSWRVLRWAGMALVLTVWVSSCLFGLYILAFYAGAAASGAMESWNGVLPGLYDPQTRAANAGIGVHFAAGGVILVLGFVQLIAAIRRKFPAVHRWLGRVYVVAALLAGVGGLTFILVKGTIGGAWMNVGFGLYGVLMIWAAVQTMRLARAGEMERHRAWSLRLFALAIGSWLYRMDYGFWILFTGGAGHDENFRGWFDVLMMFFFYLPNLLVAEAFIRGRARSASVALRLSAAGLVVVANGFLLLGTYYFTKLYWGPAIINRLIG